MPTVRKPTGRPSLGADAKRHAISCRVTPDVMAKLDASIAANGRSLAQEVETRLERDLEREEQHGGAATAALVAAIVADIAEIEEATAKAWHRDNMTYAAVRRAVIAAIVDRAPRKVENNREAVATAQAAVDAGRRLNSALRMVVEGLPGADPQTNAALRASAEANVPALEREFEAAERAAEAAYQPQIVAERRGRELYKQIISQRRAARAGKGQRHGA